MIFWSSKFFLLARGKLETGFCKLFSVLFLTFFFSIPLKRFFYCRQENEPHVRLKHFPSCKQDRDSIGNITFYAMAEQPTRLQVGWRLICDESTEGCAEFLWYNEGNKNHEQVFLKFNFDVKKSIIDITCNRLRKTSW